MITSARGSALTSATVTDVHESFDDEHLAYLPSEVREFRETGWVGEIEDES